MVILRGYDYGWGFDFSLLIFELNNVHDEESNTLHILSKIKIYSL